MGCVALAIEDEDALAGIAEIAELANVSPQAVANWRMRLPDFPVPVATLKSGPVFWIRDVRRWVDSRRTKMGGRSGFAEGASRAINKFVNELWDRFELTDRFDVDGPEGERPTDRKEDTIEWLEELMDEVARHYYKAGAWRGARELLKMQKDMGVKNRTKGIRRGDWKRAVRSKFAQAEEEYSVQDPPW